MKRQVYAALTVALALLVIAATAFANGSPTIASAQPLPLGQQVTGGAKMGCENWPYAGTEYWRVPMTGGAVLVLDYSSLNGATVNVRVFRPEVTDYTVGKESSSTSTSSSGRDQLRFRANVPGNWIVMLAGGCESEYGYELTARVERKTTVQLRGPARVRPRGTGVLRGRVVGVSDGTVSLQWYGNRRWRTFGTAYIQDDGTFSMRTTYNGKCGGVWTNRAVFSGDSEHAAGVSNKVISRASC